MDKITVYEGNSVVIGVEVLNPDGTAATLTGFTATINVRATKSSTTVLITSTGVVAANEITFTIAASSNTLTKGVYYYEIVIESASQKITLAHERFYVKESLIYVT
jgi:hypothetical protein